jgi:hypothetical protein
MRLGRLPKAILTYDIFQSIGACIFGLGLIWSGISRKGGGVRGFPEVSEQNDPPPIEFSIALIVCGLVLLGYGGIHLLR